jgi:hypothetical protein
MSWGLFSPGRAFGEFSVTIVTAALKAGFKLFGQGVVAHSFEVPARVLVNADFLIDVRIHGLVRPIQNREGKLEFDLKWGEGKLGELFVFRVETTRKGTDGFQALVLECTPIAIVFPEMAEILGR